MTAKRSIRDLERQCKKEPDNLVVRLLLAAAYREAGRTAEAVPLYRSVADTYHRQGRRTQAVAVLRSLLELDPIDAASRALLEQIERDGSGVMTALGDALPPAAAAPPVASIATPNPTPLPHLLAARANAMMGRAPEPASEKDDPDRPPTIPSLDGRRHTGSQPSARVLSEDVVLRELAPVRPPGVPASRPRGPTAPPPAAPPPQSAPSREPSPAATLTGLGLAGPGARLPSPTRGSAAMWTPTPLPAPMPFHEGDNTSNHDRVLPSDDDAATRIADSFRTGRASFDEQSESGGVGTPGALPLGRGRSPRGNPPPLRPPTLDPERVGDRTNPELDLATDLDTRRVRRVSEHELGMLGEPPTGQTDAVVRIDQSDLDDDTNPDAGPRGRRDSTIDDEPTRLADDGTARPSNEFEVPTGVRDRARTPAPPREIASPVPRPATPPPRPAKVAPQTVPATPRAARRDATPTTRARPLRPVAELEEPTRVADSTGARGRHPEESTPIPTSEHTPVRPTIRDELTTRGELTPPPGMRRGDEQSESGGVGTLGAAPLGRGRSPRGNDAPEEPTDVRGHQARVSVPGMRRSHAFAASFADTLGELDPDGAPIESPLDMFSMLPAQAIAELERRVILRRFAAGEIVIREGDPGDACYVIVDGEVRILKSDPIAPDAGPVELARLGPRSLFGEFALLADRRRHATVQATAHTDVYEIPRQVLRDLAANYPEVGPALDHFYRQRLLATLLRTAPFFTPLPEDNRARLLARFVPIRAESGESIVREGQPAGGLYLIIIGAVEITRRLERNRSVILATLREGAYFGEMSLLSGDPTTATVIATGTVELALLQPRDFYEIAAEHPELWSSIRREARARALENARLLAGETGTV